MDAQSIRDALGGVTLDAGELDAFIESLFVRHCGALRYRRSALPPDDPAVMPTMGEAVAWYALANFAAQDRPSVRPSQTLGYAAGEFFLQDAGSLLALAVCGADTDALRGKLVCDLCASPGGKATALVEAVGPDGFVVANEPIRGRLPALQFNLARTGSGQYAITDKDPTELAKQIGGMFDVVVVDAPCSGQALLSRGKQSESAISTRQIEHSAARQERIVDAAVALLAPGGRLIYSTCTFAEAENEAQIQRAIQAHGLRPLPVERLSMHQSPLASACYRLWPHRDRCAGSFAASLICDEGSPERVDHGFARKARQRPVRLPFDPLNWIDGIDESTRIEPHESTASIWSPTTPDWVPLIAAMGPEFAHRTGRTWKPSHALGRRRDCVPFDADRLVADAMVVRNVVEVDDDTARKFLSGQAITVANDSPPTGESGDPTSHWCVVAWRSRPLGWIKRNETIGKNHLPTPARL